MGTDLHLEAERQLDDGTWERIPHAAEPCWGCATYNKEKEKHENPRGYVNPWIPRADLSPEDKVLAERENGTVQVNRRNPCPWCHGTKLLYRQFLKERHYDVFAILGNVRNGYGFAGVPTSSGFEPISDCRGLPHDLSQEVVDHLARLGYSVNASGQLEYKGHDDEDDLYDTMEAEKEGYWSLGDHSFSWVLLSEIDDYNWDRGVVKEGWVDPGEFDHFRKEGAPRSWSGGISGSGVEHISDTEMAHRIDSGDIVFEEEEASSDLFGRKYTTGLQRAMGEWELPDGSVGARIRERNSIYCHIKWITPYRDCVGADFWQTVEYLRELAPGGHAKRVRLVFGFDS